MDLMRELQRLERIHTLIRLKATGTPGSLAKKLRLSERQARRLIGYMQSELGMPIEYRRERESYCYTSEVEFSFKLLVDSKMLLQITGGRNESSIRHPFF